MRILMISDVYFPRVNGVSTAIMTLRRELKRMGHEVTLIAPDYGAVTADEEDILRIPARPVWLDPEDRMMQRRHITELLPYLQGQTFDLVHIHTPFIAHYAGLELARTLGVPCVETYHTFFEEYLFHYVPFVPKPLHALFGARLFAQPMRRAEWPNRTLAPHAQRAAPIRHRQPRKGHPHRHRARRFQRRRWPTVS